MSVVQPRSVQLVDSAGEAVTGTERRDGGESSKRAEAPGGPDVELYGTASARLNIHACRPRAARASVSRTVDF